MNGQLWSWILGFVGLFGFYLAGKKLWWSWYINLANQALWLVYSLITGQYGFLVATAGYTIVFSRNAVVWTREHRQKIKRIDELLHEPLGKITRVTEDASGLKVDFVLDDQASPALRYWEDYWTKTLPSPREDTKDYDEPPFPKER